MKIFGFEIRKFESQPTTINVIETWCVKWPSVYIDYIGYPRKKTNVLAFPLKESADMYAKELRDARRLLGDKNLDIDVYKQETHTNV